MKTIREFCGAKNRSIANLESNIHFPRDALPSPNTNIQ